MAPTQSLFPSWSIGSLGAGGAQAIALPKVTRADGTSRLQTQDRPRT